MPASDESSGGVSSGASSGSDITPPSSGTSSPVSMTSQDRRAVLRDRMLPILDNQVPSRVVLRLRLCSLWSQAEPILEYAKAAFYHGVGKS